MPRRQGVVGFLESTFSNEVDAPDEVQAMHGVGDHRATPAAEAEVDGPCVGDLLAAHEKAGFTVYVHRIVPGVEAFEAVCECGRSSGEQPTIGLANSWADNHAWVWGARVEVVL